MNAADTSASKAIADCTPLTLVSRSRTTAAIDTFINEVSTTSTNIAIESNTAKRRFIGAVAASGSVSSVMVVSGRSRRLRPEGRLAIRGIRNISLRSGHWGDQGVDRRQSVGGE